MILYFKTSGTTVFAVQSAGKLNVQDIEKLRWLFDNARFLESENPEGYFIGPRKEMITPWSTNAVEITQNMGINGIIRIEEFYQVETEDTTYDPMLQVLYKNPDQEIFTIEKEPEPVLFIENIGAFNSQEGLALSND